MYSLSVKGSRFQAPVITLCCSEVYLKHTSVHTWWALIETPAHISIRANSSPSWQRLLRVPWCSLEKLIYISMPSFKTFGFQRTLHYAIAETELDLGRVFSPFSLLAHNCRLLPRLKEEEGEFPRASPALFCLISSKMMVQGFESLRCFLEQLDFWQCQPSLFANACSVMEAILIFTEDRNSLAFESSPLPCVD